LVVDRQRGTWDVESASAINGWHDWKPNVYERLDVAIAALISERP
jgi:hypothetical protein